MPLLDDIEAYLTAMGAVSTPWPLWKGRMAPTPDQGIGIFEYPGPPPDTLGRENEDVSLQTLVRGAELDYQTARAKWLEVYNLLQDARQTAGSPVLLPGYTFIQAKGQGPLTWSDGNNRPQFVSNWRVKKARS